MKWYKRDVRKQRFRVRYLVVTYKFSFFFNLVEKNSFTVKKIFKCRENGIDRLRNGNLPRRLEKERNRLLRRLQDNKQGIQ